MTFLLVVCYAVFILTFQGYVQESNFGVRNKKPFCNAFTGCGRKRSDPDAGNDELLGLQIKCLGSIKPKINILTHHIILWRQFNLSADIVISALFLDVLAAVMRFLFM